MSESSTIQWPAGLPVPLLSRKHNINPRSTMVTMESKRKRVRRVFDTEVETIDASWAFTEDQFDTFKEFFITDLEQGTQIFNLVTYEPSSIANTVKVVTRQVAFFEANYDFNRSDNLFMVSAVLVIDVDGETFSYVDLQDAAEYVSIHTVASTQVTSACGDLLTISWDAADAPDASGCWMVQFRSYGDTIWEPLYLRHAAISEGYVSEVFENHYDGTLELRVLFQCSIVNNIYWGTTVQSFTIIPTVALPTLALSGTVDGEAERPFNKVGVNQRPTCNALNPFITPDNHWTLVQHRRQTTLGLGPTDYGALLYPIITHADPAVVIKYTLDGTDPTLLTVNPGAYDGTYDSQMDEPPSKCVMRARAFKDGCQSPVAILVLDKIIDMHYAVRVRGATFLGIYSCYGAQSHRNYDDGLGGINGGDCLVEGRGCLFGNCCPVGDLGVYYSAALKAAAFGATFSGNISRVPSGSVNLPVFRIADSPIDGGPDFEAIVDPGGCNVDFQTAGSFLSGSGIWSGYSQPITLILYGQWDNYPVGFFQGLRLERESLVVGGYTLGLMFQWAFGGVFGPHQTTTDYEELAAAILLSTPQLNQFIEDFVAYNVPVDEYWTASTAIRTPYLPFILDPPYRLDPKCKDLACTALPPDIINPTIVITAPVADATWKTGIATMALQGVVSDAGGVASVTWSNSAGGSGAATLIGDDWWKDGITLVTGTNIITVTVTDVSGNTGTDILTITKVALSAFDDYEEETVEVAPLTAALIHGFGFTEAWQLRLRNALGTQALDDFDSYTAGTLDEAVLDLLQLGWGFSSSWVLGNVVTGLKSSDNFEDYPAGTVSTDLNSGTGWNTSRWVF